MSVSQFSKEWPIGAKLSDHLRHFEQGHKILASGLILPEDGRVHIGYALNTFGGRDAAVLCEGEPGTGKTEGMNLILGEDHRVDTEATDTEQTLFGAPNYTNAEEWIPGKVELALDPDNPVLGLNELGQLDNTGPYHRIFDGEVISVGQKTVSTDSIAIRAATNFPDNRRTKKLDSAAQDRFAIKELYGDSANDIAMQIHMTDIGAGTRSSKQSGGLLPSAASRAEFRKLVQETLPLNQREFGGFVMGMLTAINELTIDGDENRRLFVPVSLASARISRGWQMAARARMVVNRETDRGIVDADDAARVAALVLPTATELSHVAKSKIAEKLGSLGSKVDPLTEAIVLRRMIATLAYRTRQQLHDFETRPDDSHRAQFRDRFSYAYPGHRSDQIDELVEDLIIGGSRNNKGVTNESQSRRGWGFGRSARGRR